MNVYETIIRLVLAAILGGVIGLERERRNRTAGLRTYTLVSVGSALAMLVSLEMHYQYYQTSNADPGRIAAQVISGIGFLGAGAILREGATVKGLTTAAGLWAMAGIGLAVGAGMYIPAIVATALIFLILVWFVKFEQKDANRQEVKNLLVTVNDRPGQIGAASSIIGEMNISIKDIRLNRSEAEEGKVELDMMLQMPEGVTIHDVITRLETAQVFQAKEK